VKQTHETNTFFVHRFKDQDSSTKLILLIIGPEENEDNEDLSFGGENEDNKHIVGSWISFHFSYHKTLAFDIRENGRMDPLHSGPILQNISLHISHVTHEIQGY
jgi:hypothetical protein